MHRGETELKTKVFYSILFTVAFLLASVIVPRLGITFSFLSFGGRVAVSRVTPDILLSLVIICSMICSNRLACVLGLVFGFIYDASAATPFMFTPVIYTVSGIVSPKLSESFASRGIFGVLASSAIVFCARGVITAFYHLATWREVSMSALVVGTVLPEIIYNLIATAVLFYITVFFARLFKVEIDV